MLEPIEDQYLRVGHIARSHGVNGEVLIISEYAAPQLFEEIDLAHYQNARGDLIPVRIESVRTQQKNNRLSFFVKFEHVTDRTRAEQLKGYLLYLKKDTIDFSPREEEPVDYTSFKVLDSRDEQIGEVSGVMNNPVHPILEVVTLDQQQLLIPFVDQYIRSADEDQKLIRCQNLDQLADI